MSGVFRRGEVGGSFGFATVTIIAGGADCSPCRGHGFDPTGACLEVFEPGWFLEAALAD